ncbi:MAG: alpha/beta hydrolase, partial [Cyanobacteria bacterium REEB67]|nr:alpha/beta hydrolase [Cyanobacteria bacterium REEB67]
MTRKLFILLFGFLLAVYIFFCPCVNVGLYQCLAIHPTKEFMDFFNPYQMEDYTGTHRFFEVQDDSGRKVTLHGIYFNARNSRGTVLFSKGNAFCLKRILGARQLIVLLDLGYDLFIYDYEGFGASLGTADYRKLGNDGVAAYDFLKQTLKKDKIFLYGISMGTGVSCYIAERRPVLGLILDSPFISPIYTLKSWAPFLSIYPDFLFPAPHYDNEKYLTGKHAPTLIFTMGLDNT